MPGKTPLEMSPKSENLNSVLKFINTSNKKSPKKKSQPKEVKKNKNPSQAKLPTKVKDKQKTIGLEQLISKGIKKKAEINTGLLKKETGVSYNKQNSENIENIQKIPSKTENSWQENCIVSAKLLLTVAEKFDDKICVELFSKTTHTLEEIKLVNNWLELSNILKTNQTSKILNKNVIKSMNKLFDGKQETIMPFKQNILLYCLYDAIDNIDLKSNIYKTLLEKLNIPDENGREILHTICMSRIPNSKIVKLLLDKNLDSNLKDKFGKTALHYACENPNSTVEIIELLIKDINSLEQLSLYFKTAKEVGKNQKVINCLAKKIEIIEKETIISKNIVEKKNEPTKNFNTRSCVKITCLS